jgi:hypothetical protein
MKHTGDADALIPEFAARWRAEKKTPQQIIFNKIREKGRKEENDLPAYIMKKHPDAYPRKIIQNNL